MKLATAHMVKIGDEYFSPKHPLAKALYDVKRGREMQDEKAQELYAEMGLKPAKQQSSKNYENNPTCEVSDTKPQCDQEAALGTAIQGEDECVARVIVRITGFRVRPLDPDNFAASTKDIIDGLRHSKLIPGDEPWSIKLETDQVWVKTFAEEMTRIEIEWP